MSEMTIGSITFAPTRLCGSVDIGRRITSRLIEPEKPVTVRSVASKIFRLREPEQRRLIAQMKLDAPGDNEIKDYEVAIAAVRRAEERGKLGELDRQIDAILSDGRR